MLTKLIVSAVVLLVAILVFAPKGEKGKRDERA